MSHLRQAIGFALKPLCGAYDGYYNRGKHFRKKKKEWESETERKKERERKRERERERERERKRESERERDRQGDRNIVNRRGLHIICTNNSREASEDSIGGRNETIIRKEWTIKRYRIENETGNRMEIS